MFEKWHGSNFPQLSSLVQSLMHPISRIRLESHFSLIRLKELPNGFRVLAAESVSIESLPDEFKKPSRENILSLLTRNPEKIVCLSLYAVEDIDGVRNLAIFKGYVLGDYSDLAAIQLDAATENGRQAELIKILNKEE
jgi:hypothetical protein